MKEKVEIPNTIKDNSDIYVDEVESLGSSSMKVNF